MNIRFLRPARQELVDAIRYCNVEQAGLGGAMRRCQMQRFPYGVIYEPAATEIIVVAIAHLHREPMYWQDKASHR